MINASQVTAVSESDLELVEQMNVGENMDNLESLFTPLQSNAPVEQFVRRT